MENVQEGLRVFYEFFGRTWVRFILVPVVVREISSHPFFRLPISTVSKKNTLSLIPHSQREHHSIPYLKPHATHRRTWDGHVC